MIKVPIAASLALRVAAGAAGLEDVVAVDASNMTTNDAPSVFQPGYRAKAGELMAAMLARSDNVATNVLIDFLGRERITSDCAALGLSATAVRRKLSGSPPLIDDPEATGRNAHPAADAASLFARIDAEAGGRMRDVMASLEAQFWNDKLSGGWAPGDRFAHKTGETDEVSHDGGILTLAGGRRFVVVVYTELPSGPDADARLQEFSRTLRPYLTEGPP